MSLDQVEYSVEKDVLLQMFARKFAKELEFYFGPGQGTASGEQITVCANDVLRIDLRETDPQGIIDGFPRELKNLLDHARTNPGYSFTLGRPIEMVKRIGRIKE